MDVIFFEEEEETDHSPSQTEKSSQRYRQKEDKETQMVLGPKKDPQSDYTRKEMVLELQKLDRDRKKNLLVCVIDGLLSRSDYSQQDLTTESIKDHAAVDIANDEYTTGDNYWGQDSLQDNQREDYRENDKEVDSVDSGRETEVDEEDKPTCSAKCRQRKTGIVSVPSEGQLGLFNLGFEHEGSKEIAEECSSDTSGLRRQKKSVTFGLSEFPVSPLRNGDGENNVKVDASDQKLSTVTKRSEEEDKETESVAIENGCNPSGSEDKQDVLTSPIHPAKKRRPKTIKDWLRDLNLYKVCVILFLQQLKKVFRPNSFYFKKGYLLRYSVLFVLSQCMTIN